MTIHTDNKETLQNALKRIEELETDNKMLEKMCQDLSVHYKNLEKENAELKKQLDALSGDIPWNEIKDKSDVIGKLTEAKEIIKFLINPQLLDKPEYYDWRLKAEQFLKYSDDLENCRGWHSRDNLRK